MVMEDNPSPQHIGREFVRQYYTLLNKEPLYLHRFYSNDSSFIHGGLNPRDMNAEPAQGQQEIHRRIVNLNFRDCKTKILLVDACETLNKGVVIQVIGELSNNGMAMRRFMQTFVLATQAARKYYVRNDIFRYQDEVFSDEENSDAGREDEEERNTPEEQPTPNIYSMQPKPLPSPVPDEVAQPTVNGHPAEVYTKSPEPTPIVYQRQQTPEVIPQKTVTPAVSPKVTSPQPSPPEQQQFSTPEAEIVPEVIESWAAESAPQSIAEAQEEEVPQNNEPKTFANLFKSSSHHGIPPTAPPPFSSANLVAPQTPTEQAPSTEVTSLPPQPQRSTRGARPPRVYREKEGRGERDSWERPSSRASNEENEFKNMNGSNTRLDDRDRRGTAPYRTTQGRDWNFPDSQQVFVGNIPSGTTEAELRECFGVYSKVLGVKINASLRSAANYGFVAFESAEVVQQVLKKRPICHKTYQFNVEEKTARERGGGGGNFYQGRQDRNGDRRDDRGPGPRGGSGPRSGSGGPYGSRPRDGENRGSRRDDERGPPRRDGDDRGPRRDGEDRGPRRDGDDRGPRRDGEDRGPRRDGDDRGPRRDDRGGRGRGSERGGFNGPRR